MKRLHIWGSYTTILLLNLHITIYCHVNPCTMAWNCLCWESRRVWYTWSYISIQVYIMKVLCNLTLISSLCLQKVHLSLNLARTEARLLICLIVPDSHLEVLWLLNTYTIVPTSKSLCLEWASWFCFYLTCHCLTQFPDQVEADPV